MSKIIQLPLASFILDTGFADASANFSCDMTFYNVNFQQILGELYDKYDLFNIQLTSITGLGSSFGTNTGNRQLNIFLGGLDFQNQNYNVSTKSFNSDCIITSVTVSTNPLVSYNTQNNFLTFRKKPLATLTIKVRTISNNLPATSIAFPQSILSFIVYGVIDVVPSPLKIEDGISTEKLKRTVPELTKSKK